MIKKKHFKNCEENENGCSCDKQEEYEEEPGYYVPFAETRPESNRIFLYGEINPENILRLRLNLQQMANMIMFRSFQFSQEPANIYLHINSNGGSLFDALAAADWIKNSKVPIVTVIEGIAASAATFLSVVGHKRQIYKNSFMMIHQLSSGVIGNAEEIEQENQNCQVFMNTIKKLYLDNTKISKKQLDQILKKDQYFDAATCLKYGLVDEII